MLGLAKASVERIVETGLAGEVWQTGRTSYVRHEAIAELARRPLVAERHPAAVVVRCGPPRPVYDEEDRSFLGWHAAFSRDPSTQPAFDRWWNVAEADDYRGQTFLVAVVGFVVECFGIADVETNDYGSRRFVLKSPAHQAVSAFSGRRLGSVGGGPVVLLDDTRRLN